MITLTTSGDSVVFVFDNNDHYLQQGTIEVPMNSLSLLIDSSDMVTFKKAASNDVFVSATLSELGMTKEQLISFYKDNMVGGNSLPEEEIQAMIASATSGYADSVTFNSDNNYIEFYHDDTKVYELDASDFVIDGMIDDVRIETIGGVSYLVIDFNTASGKQDIQIPLTDIFDPSNYYTKTDIDTKLGSGFTSSSVTEVIESNERVVANAINSLNAEISGKVDTDTYTAYTAATDAALSGKQDTLSAGTNITIADNVISADIDVKGIEGGRGITVTTGETADTVSFNIPIYQGKGDYSLSLTQASGTSTNSYNNVVSGYSTVAIGAGLTVTNKYEAGLGVYNVNRPQSQGSPFGSSEHTLLTVGNGGGNAANQKHNALEVRQNGDIYYANTNDTAHTDFYTKPMVKLQDAIDGKQDTLSAGTNITISGNVISAEGGGASYSAGTDIDITNDVISVKQISGDSAFVDVTSTLENETSVAINTSAIIATMKEDVATCSIIFTDNKGRYLAVENNGSGLDVLGNTPYFNYSTDGYTITASTLASGDTFISLSGNDDNQLELLVEYFAVLATTYSLQDFADNVYGKFSGYVATSAITSSITSASTDSQIPSAKAVYDALQSGGSIEVSSAITSGDTNPVQGGVLYDELIIESAEIETTLTFFGYSSTDYPSGCTEVKVTVPEWEYEIVYFCNDDTRLGQVEIDRMEGGNPNVTLNFNGASYSVDNNEVVITYPTVTNVNRIDKQVDGTTVKAVYTQNTHLIDKVAEIEEVTAAALNSLNDNFDGLKLKKVTQAEYDNIVSGGTVDNQTLYVIVN